MAVDNDPAALEPVQAKQPVEVIEEVNAVVAPASKPAASVRAIGKSERVALRQVWKHEALNLTTWLEENIDVLNGALDLDLVNVDREQAAGAFSVDLVAED